MNVEKKSRRQQRREQIGKQKTRNRLIVGGIILLVAAFFLYAILKPVLEPIVDVVAADDSRPRYMANDNSMGDPNAPIQLVEYSDFQCPYCDRNATDVLPLLQQYYIDNGTVFFTYRSAGNFISTSMIEWRRSSNVAWPGARVPPTLARNSVSPVNTRSSLTTNESWPTVCPGT